MGLTSKLQQGGAGGAPAPQHGYGGAPPPQQQWGAPGQAHQGGSGYPQQQGGNMYPQIGGQGGQGGYPSVPGGFGGGPPPQQQQQARNSFPRPAFMNPQVCSRLLLLDCWHGPAKATCSFCRTVTL